MTRPINGCKGDYLTGRFVKEIIVKGANKFCTFKFSLTSVLDTFSLLVCITNNVPLTSLNELHLSRKTN